MEDAAYNKVQCCFLCKAHTRPDAMSAYDFSDRAAWTQTMVTNADFKSLRPHEPFIQIPGAHIDCIRPDVMHVGPLGIFQYAAGSCFAELLESGHWSTAGDTGRWEHTGTLQLERAFSEFLDWAKNRKISHSVKRFTLTKVGATSLKTSTPFYKCKTNNCYIVC